MMVLDERLMSYERVRAVSAEWSEVLLAIDRCAAAMDALGEGNHARALARDRGHIYRRAQLHIRQIASQEAARGVGLGSTRPPPMAAESEVIPRLKAVREG